MIDTSGSAQISAYCLLVDDDRILLTLDEGKEGWKLPGGKAAPDELIQETVIRELKEETGLDGRLTGLVTIQDYFNREAIHRIRVYFTAKLISGELRPMPGEVRALHWKSVDEVATWSVEQFFVWQYFAAVQRYIVEGSLPLTIINQGKPRYGTR